MKQNLNTVEKNPSTNYDIPINKIGDFDHETDAIIRRVTLLREVEIAEMDKTELYFWSNEEHHDYLNGGVKQELYFNCPEPRKGYYAVPPSAGKIRIRTENE